jgi:hypothetical protein
MATRNIGPLGYKGTSDIAKALFEKKLPDLLTAGTYDWVTPQAEALYRPTGPLTQWCLMCLRAYDPDENRVGGADQIWCSKACRLRGSSTRRANLPTEWRKCVVCATPFLCLSTGSPRIPSGKVICPPRWPAEYWDTSPCKAARRRQLNRGQQAAHRLRESVKDEAGRAMLAFRITAIEVRPMSDAAQVLGIDDLAAGTLAAQCAAWIRHLAGCRQPRSCAADWARPAHKNVVKILRLSRALDLPRAERVAWLDNRALRKLINEPVGPVDSGDASTNPLSPQPAVL